MDKAQEANSQDSTKTVGRLVTTVRFSCTTTQYNVKQNAATNTSMEEKIR
ncbi:MAG: hypothetical protein H6940_07170 [Burkholderiales bacterium]|nr:hypothetical protein [Burkholderiales bacterium]